MLVLRVVGIRPANLIRLHWPFARRKARWVGRRGLQRHARRRFNHLAMLVGEHSDIARSSHLAAARSRLLVTDAAGAGSRDVHLLGQRARPGCGIEFLVHDFLLRKLLHRADHQQNFDELSVCVD